MSKHTPGPWQIIAPGFIGTVEADPQTIGYASDHRNTRTRPLEEQVANARLMAAAPDLLEALEALADFSTEYGPSPRASSEDWADFLSAARKALAKARG